MNFFLDGTGDVTLSLGVGGVRTSTADGLFLTYSLPSSSHYFISASSAANLSASYSFFTLSSSFSSSIFLAFSFSLSLCEANSVIKLILPAIDFFP
jgi:hypothetical protein